jgi:gas vesicle protein
MPDPVYVCNPSDFNLIKDALIPLGSAFLGAVVGAIAGYFPAKKLAKSASDEILTRDAEERRTRRAQAARQVFVKVHALANSIGSYHKQIEGMVAKADADGNTSMRIFERLSTFAGVEREPSIDFNADELEIFMTTKNSDYVNKLLLASRRYSACLGHFVAFGKMKANWHDQTLRLGKTTRDENGVSRTVMRVSPDIANYLKNFGDEIEIYAVEMRSLTSEYTKYISDVALEFKTVTEGIFESGERLSFEPNDEMAAPSA